MELKICNFETAKLLKEKGFDIPTLMCYEWMEHKTHLCQNIQEKGKLENWNSHTGEENDYVLIFYSAPTLDLVCKWLREVHNSYLDTYMSGLGKDGFAVKEYKFIREHKVLGHCSLADTYEEAQEIGIIEALKLIE